MSAYPKYSNEVVAYLRKKELEAYRALNSERYELRAAVNGAPNGYKPVSEAELNGEVVVLLA